MEKQILTPEQFEQAKRELQRKYARKTYGLDPTTLQREPTGYDINFMIDLTALLEQHKEMMCSQCQKQHRTFTYPGRPDPRDVNPYDIRSVHRARNPRKRT